MQIREQYHHTSAQVLEIPIFPCSNLFIVSFLIVLPLLPRPLFLLHPCTDFLWQRRGIRNTPFPGIWVIPAAKIHAGHVCQHLLGPGVSTGRQGAGRAHATLARKVWEWKTHWAVRTMFPRRSAQPSFLSGQVQVPQLPEPSKQPGTFF